MKAIRFLLMGSLFFLLQFQSKLIFADDLLQCPLQPSIVIVPTAYRSLSLQCPAGTVVVNQGQIISKLASQLFFNDKPGMCKLVNTENITMATFNAVYACRPEGSSDILVTDIRYNAPSCPLSALNCSRLLLTTKGVQILDGVDPQGNKCLCPLLVR
jgi:hypothetical protein